MKLIEKLKDLKQAASYAKNIIFIALFAYILLGSPLIPITNQGLKNPKEQKYQTSGPEKSSNKHTFYTDIQKEILKSENAFVGFNPPPMPSVAEIDNKYLKKRQEWIKGYRKKTKYSEKDELLHCKFKKVNFDKVLYNCFSMRLTALRCRRGSRRSWRSSRSRT